MLFLVVIYGYFMSSTVFGVEPNFDDKIFNALIDRIEVLESTHFVFVLKNVMRVEENIDKIQRI